jgi:hypothetical protein
LNVLPIVSIFKLETDLGNISLIFFIIGSFKLTKFLEEEGIPNDSKIIGESWAKINKDGTPDKRFKGNYQIPIVEYAEIEFKSNSGIYEVFMFSNTSFANDFVEKYNNYLS